MGITKKTKDERAAVKAGTHEESKDAFGNRYLKELPPPAPQYECIHCGGKVVEILGEQITPGVLAPFKHAPGAQKGCPKAWGPLEDSDVRTL